MNPVIVNKDEAIVLEGTGADDHLSSIAASRKRQGFLVDGASASGTPIGSQSELYAGSCMTNIVMACQSARKGNYYDDNLRIWSDGRLTPFPFRSEL